MRALKLKAPPAPKEWHEQRVVFEWAKMHEGREPRLKLLNGSMNGLQVANPGIIVRAKMCGLKPGYPDIYLPVIDLGQPLIGHTYYGWYCEIKRKHPGWNRCGWDCASPDQIWWRDALSTQGRRVDIAHGADEAIRYLQSYLGMQ